MKRAILAMLVFVSCAIATLGQAPVTGRPPFGSFNDGQFDAVNRQNLNANFAIPIVSNPGRGLDFSLSIVYDSLIWAQTGGTPNTFVPVVDNSGNPTWGWKLDAPQGRITYTWAFSGQIKCFDGGDWYMANKVTYSNFAYTDILGTRHPFNVSRTFNPCTESWSGGVSAGYATDASGYYIDITNGPDAGFVKDADGATFPGTENAKDTNGNYITRTNWSQTETRWTDTLGRVVLKILKKTSPNCVDSNSAGHPECREYVYWATDGSEKTAKLFLDSFNVKTYFYCGITEYDQTGKLLPARLELANGRTYLFEYEQTPGDSSKTTARLSKVTLSTGGYYKYVYPNNPPVDNGGINCADGTMKNLTRVISESGPSQERSWLFTRTFDGTYWKTRETPPTLSYDSGTPNESTFTFNTSGQLLTTKFYQGTEGAGTLLRTINAAWALNGTPSSEVLILEDTPGGTKLQSKTETVFDSYGNLKELKEFDFGSGSPPAPYIRKTTITYLHESQSAYLTRNIIDRPKTIQVDDTSGNKKSETVIDYDQGSLTQVAGAPQHDYTNYPYTMTTRGNPTHIKRWLTGTTNLTTLNAYDELGNLRAVTDPKNYSTTISYTDNWYDSTCPPSSSSFAFPTLVTNHLGHRLQVIYYACSGQVREIRDENDISNSRSGTRFTYTDPLRRITQTDFAGGGQTTVTYTDGSNQVTISQKRTSSETISVTDLHNGLGQLKQRLLPGNRKIDIEYDELGGEWRVYNPYVTSGDATYGYVETRVDGLGRVKLFRKQDTQVVQMTYAGKAAKVINEVNKERITEVDGLGRLTKVCEVTSLTGSANCGIGGYSSAVGYATSYIYNERDDLTLITQDSQTRDFTYDNLSRLTTAKILEVSTSNSIEYQYDDNSNRTSVKDPRNRICFEYDALNRLLRKRHALTTDTCPSGTVVGEFVYDGSATTNSLGRLRTEWDGAAGSGDKTESSYDSVGRVSAQSRSVSGTTYVTSLGYDLMGNVVMLNYPSSSGTRRQIEYTFKATGTEELDKVRDITGTPFDYVTATTYSNLGPLEQITFQNQVQTVLGWNKRGLVTSILTRKDQGGGSYQNRFHLIYQYHNNGQISQILNQLVTDQTKDEKFTYDDLLRLATAQRGPDTDIQRKYVYEYDRYGNRWKQDWVAGAYGIDKEMGFNTANNRTTDSGFAYDLSGNLTANGVYTGFAFNPENINTGAPSSTYSVDAQGRRVKKTVSGTTSDYFFMGSEIIAEKTGSSWKDYIFFAGQRIAEQTGSTAFTATYLHTDHLGSTRLCTDANGNPSGTCDYEPYGETQPGVTCSLPTKFRFAGMEFDEESELYHTWFRQYDPRQGRWMSVDPLPGTPDNLQSLNRYIYVLDDPVNLVDPLGLEHDCAFYVERCMETRGGYYCWDEGHFCGQGGGGGRQPCDDGRSRFASGLPPCPTGSGQTPAPPAQRICEGEATFRFVSRGQATGRAVFGNRSDYTVAISPADFGLDYPESGRNMIRRRTATQAQLAPLVSSITIQPQQLVSGIVGPMQPYSLRLTVSDIGDRSIRTAAGTNFDVYTSLRRREARRLGVQTVKTRITLPPSLPCPEGFKEVKP